MVPVKHPVIIGNFSSKIAATDALMMGGIRTCVDRHAKQGLSVWCSSQTHDLWGRFQQRKNCLAKDIHKQQKKHNQKHNHQKNNSTGRITRKKKEKEQENNNKNNKKEHIKSKPGFPKFLFLFFVCLFCCCFVTLCFVFFMLFFFLFLVFKFDFVCLLCCFLFVYTTLFYLRRWPDNSRHMDTLATPKSKCQDMSRWLCVLAKLESVFLTTFDCSWRCNHCQSARYPGKKYKFFAGERRYSHWYQKTKGLKYPSKN